ncbi:hypothetical protein [Nocardia paucivorans]|uniref:hypothetical protein n=1 Tax=Nocardia paucivorans TaxID=114259 RepID=UPI0002D4AE77|nr:hypothetical protein [Nocardia paucivorans]
MTTIRRSTRPTNRFTRALMIAAAPVLLSVGLVTAGAAQAEQDPDLPTCSWPNLVCGPQTDLTPGDQTDLTPGDGADLTPGGPTDLTPGY